MHKHSYFLCLYWRQQQPLSEVSQSFFESCMGRCSFGPLLPQNPKVCSAVCELSLLIYLYARAYCLLRFRSWTAALTLLFFIQLWIDCKVSMLPGSKTCSLSRHSWVEILVHCSILFTALNCFFCCCCFSTGHLSPVDEHPGVFLQVCCSVSMLPSWCLSSNTIFY